MSYGLIYKIKVPSLRKNSYVVEIEKDGYTGEVTILTGGGEPFTTSLADDDFVYEPLRLSTAKLSVVGGDELSSLFATGYQQYRVTLLKDDTPVWLGFIKPELYTQDYSTHTHEISMDCVSAISTLEYVKYVQSSASGLKFVSLKYLLSTAISSARARYGKVYIPHAFAISAEAYGENALMRDDCVITEQNFFDEEDKAMSCKEILEEICRFAHVTLYDDFGDLYFIDPDYTDAYDEWTMSGGELTLTGANAVTPSSHSVQDIGFGGSGHTLDIIAGYNKATIKISNYNNADKVFPEEDWENLKALSVELSQYNITSAIKVGMKTTYNNAVARGRAVWLTPKKWEVHTYLGSGMTEDGIDMSTLLIDTHGEYYDNKGVAIDEKVTEITDLSALVFDATNLSHVLAKHTDGDYLNMIAWETNAGMYTTVKGTIASGQKNLYGAFLAKYCDWQLNDDGTDSITSYSNEQIIFVRKYAMYSGLISEKNYDSVLFLPGKYKGIFNYKGHMPVAAYADGAIAINLQVVTIGYARPSSAQGMAKNGFYYSTEKNTYAAGAVIEFTFILRIGENYWNGTEWTTSASTFVVKSKEMKEAGSFTELSTNKVLSAPYNDLTGWIIETHGTMMGELYVELVDVSDNCAIKDFRMKFQLRDEYAIENDDDDRVYTNVVNKDYINELDEIEEKISSYNHDGLCYSKVLINKDFITDNLYEGINKEITRPENLLLRRIVNQYEYPRMKITQVLMNDPTILPVNIFTDKYQGTKKFIMSGLEKNYRMDTAEIKMIEKA